MEESHSKVTLSLVYSRSDTLKLLSEIRRLFFQDPAWAEPEIPFQDVEKLVPDIFAGLEEVCENKEKVKNKEKVRQLCDKIIKMRDDAVFTEELESLYKTFVKENSTERTLQHCILSLL